MLRKFLTSRPFAMVAAIVPLSLVASLIQWAVSGGDLLSIALWALAPVLVFVPLTVAVIAFEEDSDLHRFITRRVNALRPGTIKRKDPGPPPAPAAQATAFLANGSHRPYPSRAVPALLWMARRLTDAIGAKRRLRPTAIVLCAACIPLSLIAPLGIALYAAIYWQSFIALMMFGALAPARERPDGLGPANGLGYLLLVACLAMAFTSAALNFDLAVGRSMRLIAGIALAVAGLPFIETATADLTWAWHRVHESFMQRLSHLLDAVGDVIVMALLAAVVWVFALAIAVSSIGVGPDEAETHTAGVERFQRSMDPVVPVLETTEDIVAPASNGTRVAIPAGTRLRNIDLRRGDYDPEHEAWVVLLNGSDDPLAVRVPLDKLRRSEITPEETYRDVFAAVRPLFRWRALLESATFALLVGLAVAALSIRYDGLSRVASWLIDATTIVGFYIFTSPYRYVWDAGPEFIWPYLLVEAGIGVPIAALTHEAIHNAYGRWIALQLPALPARKRRRRKRTT